MDALILARLQFAITTVYHFFFVPLTMGLSLIVAVMETLYVRTGQDVYKRMTKFWGKLFLINFAIGVVTGIVQEFQFGMNWSEYSRYVGDIFGAPLAIEALMAFFLESTFLGVWLFGWDKLPKGTHALSIWLVAIAANISALWILIANSFMQQPVGYVINNGRAEMVDFFSVVLNPNIWTQFPHVFSAALTTAAIFVLGISAYHLVRKNDTEAFKRSMQIAAVVGCFAAILVAINGHSQAQHVGENQPMKMAAMEALWETEEPAPLSMFTIGSLDGKKEVWSLRLPSFLSLLACDNLNCKVLGMNELQERYTAQYGPDDYTPPPFITYWSFRAMVGAGMLIIVVTGYSLFIVLGDLYDKSSRFLKILPFTILLPYLANASGWLLTEVGRFPWAVYGLVKLEDGLSVAVSTGEVLITLIGYTLVYAILILATIYLFIKYARVGAVPTLSPTSEVETVIPMPTSVADAQGS
jgi:cytochrome d ubiquinol oxidase subunit I